MYYMKVYKSLTSKPDTEQRGRWVGAHWDTSRENGYVLCPTPHTVTGFYKKRISNWFICKTFDHITYLEKFLYASKDCKCLYIKQFVM